MSYILLSNRCLIESFDDGVLYLWGLSHKPRSFIIGRSPRFVAWLPKTDGSGARGAAKTTSNIQTSNQKVSEWHQTKEIHESGCYKNIQKPHQTKEIHESGCYKNIQKPHQTKEIHRPPRVDLCKAAASPSPQSPPGPTPGGKRGAACCPSRSPPMGPWVGFFGDFSYSTKTTYSPGLLRMFFCFLSRQTQTNSTLQIAVTFVSRSVHSQKSPCPALGAPDSCVLACEHFAPPCLADWVPPPAKVDSIGKT